MSRNKMFYQIVQREREADINVFGDITSLPWFDSDVSAHTLKSDIDALTDVERINVHINSYGGEVAEGLAIYNTLKNHKAKVATYCDGFACSIASVIFMAGDERVMNEASLLMIHNAWTWAQGNANELRKQADDLEKITEQSKTIYLSKINIDRETLDSLMDEESWISPEDAVDMGFATKIEKDETDHESQSAKMAVIKMLAGKEVSLMAKKVKQSEKADLIDEIIAMLQNMKDEEDDSDTKEPEGPETEESTEIDSDDSDKDDDEEEDANAKAWAKFFK